MLAPFQGGILLRPSKQIAHSRAPMQPRNGRLLLAMKCLRPSWRSGSQPCLSCQQPSIGGSHTRTHQASPSARASTQAASASAVAPLPAAATERAPLGAPGRLAAGCQLPTAPASSPPMGMSSLRECTRCCRGRGWSAAWSTCGSCSGWAPALPTANTAPPQVAAPPACPCRLALPLQSTHPIGASVGRSSTCSRHHQSNFPALYLPAALRS